MSTPDYNQWLNSVWGWPTDYIGAIPTLLVNGIRQPGQNPPFTAVDLLQMYPKFFGAPTPVLCETTLGSATVAAVPTPGVAVGQLMVLPTAIAPGTSVLAATPQTLQSLGDFTEGYTGVLNVPDTGNMLMGEAVTAAAAPAGATLAVVGFTTVILSAPAPATALQQAFTVAGLSLTLSSPATASTTATAAIYTAPPVPLPIISVYVNLARNSLDAVRWGELWPLAVAAYAAHFITLWMQSDGGTFTTPASIAQRGIRAGLMVSKSADGLSASYAPLSGLQDWGAWNLTGYGQQLATWASAIGSGSMLIL